MPTKKAAAKKKAAAEKPAEPAGLRCTVVGPAINGVPAGGTVEAPTVSQARKWVAAGLVTVDGGLTDGDLVALIEAGHP